MAGLAANHNEYMIIKSSYLIHNVIVCPVASFMQRLHGDIMTFYISDFVHESKRIMPTKTTYWHSLARRYDAL